MAVRSYQELAVWQKAMTLAEDCYRLTRGFPRDELFGITSQIRRSAGSVPANIAEGQGRHSTKEFLHHLSIARGSLKELETHLILSQRIGLLPNDQLPPLLDLVDEVGRMLTGLRKSLQHKAQGG
jgi:four helix bundle protein